MKYWALFTTAFMVVMALTVSPAYAAAEKGPKKCSDTLDNDGDGLFDGDDPDCSGGEPSGKVSSWTGEDLYDDRKVMFPTDFPSLVGTSIVFPGGTIENGKLIEIGLKGIPKNKDILVRVTMNLTRLSTDWDPYIVLTDGSNWSGIAVYDSIAPGGGVSRLEGTDSGDRGVIQTNTGLFTVATGFPAINGTVDVTVEFTLTNTSTMISASMLGGSGSYLTAPLSISDGLSFVFMRDNEANESYGVNTLSIETVQSP